jgi:hypothetical protein
MVVNDFMRLADDDDEMAKGEEGGPPYPEKIEPANNKEVPFIKSIIYYTSRLGFFSKGLRC